jgi:hypothetical protein
MGRRELSKLINFSIFILFFNSFCLAQTDSPPAGSNATTFFADMKGDGAKEKILAITNGGIFKSLAIYEQDQLVYQTGGENDIGAGSLANIKVCPLRNGPKSQIFLDIYYNDAAGSAAKVIEWVDGKYEETLSQGDLDSATPQDVEGDGNFQIVLTGYKSNYNGSLPDIYDFDPAQKNMFFPI